MLVPDLLGSFFIFLVEFLCITYDSPCAATAGDEDGLEDVVPLRTRLDYPPDLFPYEWQK